MKYKLAISIFSTLLLLVACSRIEEPSTEHRTVSAGAQSKQRITSSPETFAYEINTDELAGGVEVSTAFGTTEVSASNTGTVEGRRFSRGVTPVVLFDASGEAVAYDALVFGIEESKDTVVFNAENAVRGQIMLHPVLWGIDPLRKAEIYGEIGKHPRFAEVAQRVKDNKRVIRNDYWLNTINTIAIEVANKYYEDKGLQNPNYKYPDSEGNLSPQSILESYDWADTFLGINQDANDSNKLRIESRARLSQRVFVYPFGETPDDVNDLRNRFLKSGVSDFLGASKAPPVTIAMLNIELDLPDEDCQVYEVITASFASSFRGNGTPILEDPLVDNLLSLTTDVISVISPMQKDFSDATPEELEAIETLMRTYFNAQSAANFREALAEEDYETAGKEFVNWLYENEEVVQTIFRLDFGLEQLVRASAEFFVKDGAGFVKLAEAASVIVDIAVFASASLNELNGEFSSAIISTGDPEFSMDFPDKSLKGAVGEVLTGAFTIKNTGCRAMEYKATVKPSTFPTELGAPGGGTVEAGAEVQQPFQVTCDRAGTGTANFHLVAYDAVAKLDHAAANPVVDVVCSSNITVDAYAVHPYGSRRSSWDADSGEKVRLGAYVRNDDTRQGVEWSAEVGQFVTKNRQTYYVAPVQNPDEGRSVEVTATSKADPSKSGTFSINVRPIRVSAFAMNGRGNKTAWGYTAKSGRKVRIAVTVYDDAMRQGVEWSVSGPGSIAVDKYNRTYFHAPVLPCHEIGERHTEVETIFKARSNTDADKWDETNVITRSQWCF